MCVCVCVCVCVCAHICTYIFITSVGQPRQAVHDAGARDGEEGGGLAPQVAGGGGGVRGGLLGGLGCGVCWVWGDWLFWGVGFGGQPAACWVGFGGRVVLRVLGCVGGWRLCGVRGCVCALWGD